MHEDTVPLGSEASFRGQNSGLWAPNGKVAERVGGTEGGNNPTSSPSFRGAGAETVAMVTIAPWSGDFSFSSPPFALLQAAAMVAIAGFSPSPYH